MCNEEFDKTYKSNIEFIEYKAHFLNEINNEYINDEETRLLYEFILERFYLIFKCAKKEHNKFFWMLNELSDDYIHYTTQAKAWGIPVYDFEKDKKEVIFQRVVQGVGFIMRKGTEAQVKEMLDIIFEEGKWDFVKEYTSSNRISLDIYNYSKDNVDNAKEYLENAIPPYIQIEYIDNEHKVQTARDHYDDIVKQGGSSHLMKQGRAKEFFLDCMLLPHEAFKIGKSKLNEDVVKLIKEIKEENKETKIENIKAIIFFIEKCESKERALNQAKRLVHESEYDNIYIFDVTKEEFGKW